VKKDQPEAAANGSRPVFRSASIIWIALAIGLLAGFGEVGLLWWQKIRWGRMAVNPSYMWLSPLLYGFATLVIGTLMAAVRRLAPRLLSFQAAIFLPLALCAASLLGLKFSGLHPWANAILAAGIGVQGARVISGHAPTVARVARWLALVLMTVTAGLAAYTKGTDWRVERQAWDELPDAEAGSVSVLLLVLDTVGAQHLSLYGYGRPTSPVLEKWARRGVTFDHAISTAPWTLPSHASMMTGLYPHEFAYGWFEPVRTRKLMLAEAFKARGYATGGFVANLIYLGEDYRLNRGFIRYEAARATSGVFIKHAWLMRRAVENRRIRAIIGTDQDPSRPPVTTINRRFLEWHERRAKGRPFFIFLNYFDAHKPYVPPHQVFRRIAGYERTNDLDPLSRYTDESRRNATPAEIRLSRDAYDAAIAKQDSDMGALLDEMERRGMLRNTLVVITSDHGEEFGEHGVYYHGHTLHTAALHVPLVIIGPGVPAGVRVTEPVTLRDIAATVTTLARLSTATAFPGVSLARTWSGESSAPGARSPVISETKRGIRLPDRYPNARHDAHAIVDGALHYIRIDDGREQLFDWFADPGEEHNLLGTAGDSVPVRLRSALQQALASKRAP